MTNMKIEQTEAKIGAYLMHKGTLCRLESEPHPGRFSVELVTVYPHNMTVQCGGMVSAYAADEFTPIANPFWQAAALSFENKRLAKQHQLALSRAESEAEIWERVAKAINQIPQFKTV